MSNGEIQLLVNSAADATGPVTRQQVSNALTDLVHRQWVRRPSKGRYVLTPVGRKRVAA